MLPLLRKSLPVTTLSMEAWFPKDFTTTAIIGLLEPGAKDKDVIDQVEAMIAKYPGTEKVLLGGSPYMRMQKCGNDAEGYGSAHSSRIVVDDGLSLYQLPSVQRGMASHSDCSHGDIHGIG